MALVNYNRSILTNLVDGVSIPVTATPRRIMEFGLFVNNPTNFAEVLTTIGWKAEETDSSSTSSDESNSTENRGTLLIEVRMDGITVGNTRQEAVSDRRESTINMSTTFQKVLTNVTQGHHVFQVFVSNAKPTEGSLTITGPASVSGKVIVNTPS